MRLSTNCYAEKSRTKGQLNDTCVADAPKHVDSASDSASSGAIATGRESGAAEAGIRESEAQVSSVRTVI